MSLLFIFINKLMLSRARFNIVVKSIARITMRIRHCGPKPASLFDALANAEETDDDEDCKEPSTVSTPNPSPTASTSPPKEISPPKGTSPPKATSPPKETSPPKAISPPMTSSPGNTNYNTRRLKGRSKKTCRLSKANPNVVKYNPLRHTANLMSAKSY